jgi:hypothetical protein
VGLVTTRVGEPDAGNLHVRFDEGEQLTAAPYSTLVVQARRAAPWATIRSATVKRAERWAQRRVGDRRALVNRCGILVRQEKNARGWPGRALRGRRKTQFLKDAGPVWTLMVASLTASVNRQLRVWPCRSPRAGRPRVFAVTEKALEPHSEEHDHPSQAQPPSPHGRRSLWRSASTQACHSHTLSRSAGHIRVPGPGAGVVRLCANQPCDSPLALVLALAPRCGAGDVARAVTRRPAAGHAMTYDPPRGVTLKFGGGNRERAFNDLWGWDGERWSLLSSSGPSARNLRHLSTTDTRRHVARSSSAAARPTGLVEDTWEWDGQRSARARRPRPGRATASLRGL